MADPDLPPRNRYLDHGQRDAISSGYTTRQDEDCSSVDTVPPAGNGKSNHIKKLGQAQTRDHLPAHHHDEERNRYFQTADPRDGRQLDQRDERHHHYDNVPNEENEYDRFMPTLDHRWQNDRGDNDNYHDDHEDNYDRIREDRTRRVGENDHCDDPPRTRGPANNYRDCDDDFMDYADDEMNDVDDFKLEGEMDDGPEREQSAHDRSHHTSSSKRGNQEGEATNIAQHELPGATQFGSLHHESKSVDREERERFLLLCPLEIGFSQSRLAPEFQDG
ncbi:unnamed protein product, partial [Amoebophrya sp. A25]|eukprot:GSA25T00018876001.1